MKILLFGVSNVGKSTVGRLPAERLGFGFADLDEEIKKHLEMSLEEFVYTADLRWRDQKRGCIIKKVLKTEDDMVLAVTPISFAENFKTRIIGEDVLLIELYYKRYPGRFGLVWDGLCQTWDTQSIIC